MKDEGGKGITPAANGATFSFSSFILHPSSLIRRALTHRSAARSVADSNERLEFLGDALLGVWAARRLLDGLPPHVDEGALSRARTSVVCGATLAQAARALGFPDLLTVGPGERKENRHNHDGPLADAFEAVVAALYLEHGEDAMNAFLDHALAQPLARALAGSVVTDPKTRLQEALQARGLGLPVYAIVAGDGAGHDHTFRAEARARSGELIGEGVGPNKRGAERAAAEDALHRIAGPVSKRAKIKTS